MNRFLLATVASLALCSRLSAAEPPALPLGSSAPDFDLPGVDGHNWSLKNFAHAKILVVIFTCDHCPTAQYYEERIKQLATDYKDKSVAVVAISPHHPKTIPVHQLGSTDISDTFQRTKIL